MNELREKLNGIVNSGQYTIQQHPDAVAKLGEQIVHSIQCLEVSSNLPYNCFAYALNVVDSGPITDILRRDAQLGCPVGVKFGTDLMERLIKNEILAPGGENESLIVYFTDGRPSHAGRHQDGRVRSKWGIGCLWEHDIWDVPSSYGDEYQLFILPARETVEKQFQEYFAELEANAPQ
jgi:hypothetical protein